MSQITVNDWTADECVRRDRLILHCCQQANRYARITCKLAVAHSDRALINAARLDQRLTVLLSRLPSPQLSAIDERRPLLRILAGLDHAEATANKILALDVGPNIDALAETLGKSMEEMGKNVTELLQCQRSK